ncbi:MAG TPA: DNA polymerase ligase N-terminal domain-containing protein [Patescibacteria group bacterium]|nr:DNA polymerase ligase N-terminal domain-containing protein [Patescibacteria group bacterium]
MTLKEYKKKRKFSKTTEPKSTPKKIISKGKKFVIQEHHASHLHWDLRLQMNKVLRSWAIPKTPPATKGIRRLAINVEDHPLAYAKFHGKIPKGNYGAGTVKIWDSGKYDLLAKDEKKIEFVLHGRKLHGKYVLVRTHYGNKPNKSWLFMKI